MNIIVQISLPSTNQLSLIKENQTLIGSFNSHQNKEKIQNLSKKNINVFSLELLPRITRAQSMDILSSQANLAGYKAVIESFAFFEKAIPMMMTAAGTVPPAKVLVVGAGGAVFLRWRSDPRLCVCHDMGGFCGHLFLHLYRLRHRPVEAQGQAA